MKRNCYGCPYKFECYTASGLATLKPDELSDCGRIEVITSEEASAILELFEQGKADERLGLYLLQEGGRWVAIDNEDGNAWTEDFQFREVAERWLWGDYDTDEAHEIDANWATATKQYRK